MLGCKRRCRRCYPNGCCGFCTPPPIVQQQIATVIDVKKDVKEKEIPYGHIQIYPGKKDTSTYTSDCRR